MWETRLKFFPYFSQEIKKFFNIPRDGNALKETPHCDELIFHSDRGIPYACNAFTKLLGREKLVIRSMSRKGNCWDNAIAERFSNTIKVERVYHHRFFDQEHAKLTLLG